MKYILSFVLLFLISNVSHAQQLFEISNFEGQIYSKEYVRGIDKDGRVISVPIINNFVPKWVVGCDVVNFKIDISSVIENAEEEMYEEFEDIVDRDELYEFIDKWNAKQTGCSYHPNYKIIVEFNK